MLTFGCGMEGPVASEGVTGVGALTSFGVATGEVVFGTSSTIAVAFETGRTTFPRNGIGGALA
jgi:hypothetical protein